MIPTSSHKSDKNIDLIIIGYFFKKIKQLFMIFSSFQFMYVLINYKEIMNRCKIIF